MIHQPIDQRTPLLAKSSVPDLSLIQATPFQRALSQWFETSLRDLPWRASKKPYFIWISEIILQQTRVDQGTPYFERFVRQFPTLEALASASIDDVLKAWEGLGYYSRARNLHKGARFVQEAWNGRLPQSYSELLTIPGIGPYTAAAISSIAFSLPEAVLDGNVIRVLTRLFSFSDDVTTAQSKKWLNQAASHLLDERNPGLHNEAMMELGALVCTPISPSCDTCPVSVFCSSFAAGDPLSFPTKKAKKPIPHYDIAVGIIRNDQGEIYIQRRSEDGMLGGLWEFPGGKNEKPESLEATCEREILEETGFQVEIGSKLVSIPHTYSHFKITLHAFECNYKSEGETNTDLPWQWAAREHLAEYAFPTANRKLIDVLTASEDAN